MTEQHHHYHQPPHRAEVELKPTRRGDSTPWIIGLTLFALLIFGGLIWATSNDHDRDTHVAVTSEQPVADQDPETFVRESSVVITDLRSDVDTLARSTSAENQAAIAAYRQRLDQLESELQQARQESPEARAQLQAQVNSLKADYNQLEDKVGRSEATAQQAEQTSELTAYAEKAEKRVEDLEQRVDELEGRVQADSLTSELEMLSQRIDEVSSKVDEMQTADDSQSRQQLKSEIDLALNNLERELDDLATQVG
ncbi:MAG: hypothetical protein KC910_11770 [Candidatus Eremiobacteraeota bacterium]|nr:hypothetical protein [Candidatus Eremiobacteraeota bacterium]